MWILILVLAAPAGCGAPRASEGGFDSPNPASRLYAIRLAGQQRDASAIPDLIESLESDDQAVRMMAIIALEQVTGTRMGYDPYARQPARQVTADNWTRAWRAGRFDSLQSGQGKQP